VSPPLLPVRSNPTLNIQQHRQAATLGASPTVADVVWSCRQVTHLPTPIASLRFATVHLDMSLRRHLKQRLASSGGIDRGDLGGERRRERRQSSSAGLEFFEAQGKTKNQGPLVVNTHIYIHKYLIVYGKAIFIYINS
jgi:hypothetical protein